MMWTIWIFLLAYFCGHVDHYKPSAFQFIMTLVVFVSAILIAQGLHL
jgi:hypothetical protein